MEDLFAKLSIDFTLPELNYPETNLEYLSPELFSHYLGVILSNYKNVNKSTISKTLQDDFLEINFENLEFRLPNNIYSSIHKNTREISVLPITLNFPYPMMNSHANVLIINPFTKNIEFFEPQGIFFSNTPANIIDTTTTIINIFLKIFPEFSKFNIINSSKSCSIGIQTLQNTVNKRAGHCLAWSLLFIQLRLRYIDQDVDSVVLFLSQKDPKELDSYIKRYITFLNTIGIISKKFNTFQLDGFRELLSISDLNLEKKYLQNLIKKYLQKLEQKSQAIKNDTSSDICQQCKSIGINSNHKFSFCSFNQEMLNLNRSIKKLCSSVNGYKNTINFDEIYFDTIKKYF